ncbi:MAG TPA: GDSL-type esterase/lipase family protein [Pyrinomonadaceae bacterium]|nr:GDSL-type esterase/lipase family protein [Pyrinomonadaceae bacterium]
MKVFVSVFLLILMNVFVFGQKQIITVFLAGDSTMAQKASDKRPETGWGEYLQSQFDESRVKIENHAQNGRSTKSFIAEGRWQAIVDKLKKGDYVFIEFGHNDEKLDKPGTGAAANGEYRDNLIRFIKDVRAKKAFPVLLTPVMRRRFNEKGEFFDTHGEYPDAVRKVAAEFKVPLIDMHHKSEAVIKKLGVEDSKKLFLILKPKEHPNYPEGIEDNTHFSAFGAEQMARQAADGIREAKIKLAKYLIKDDGENFRSRLLPANYENGFRMDGYWVWCGSSIKGDDGKYHIFASRWSNSTGFSPYWLTNSEIVHAVSDSPQGPYKFSDVALPPRGAEFWDGQMTHNPAIRKAGDTYLLYYTGTTYKGARPSKDNPVREEDALKLEAHTGERIGLATSKSPYGPWKRLDKPILDTRPNSWEQYLVSNAAPVVMKDGKVWLYYKGVEKLRVHAIGLAIATCPTCEYKRVSDKPLNMGVGAEDPFIWQENGKFKALMLDHERRFSPDKEIFYAVSSDGLKWHVPRNAIAVSRNVLFEGGSTKRMNSTERPHVLIENGKPTHVFFATGETIDGKRYTWNMAIPLKK